MTCASARQGYLSNLCVLTGRNLRFLPTAEVKNQKIATATTPPFRCSADVKAPLHTRVAPPSTGCLLQRFLPWPVDRCPWLKGLQKGSFDLKTDHPFADAGILGHLLLHTPFFGQGALYGVAVVTRFHAREIARSNLSLQCDSRKQASGVHWF